MNLVCNTDLTTQGTVGKCECRHDMKWNTAEGECQFYLDVDCSSFTYDTKPSANILAAVERANAAIPVSQANNNDEATGKEELRTFRLIILLLSQDGDDAGESGQEPAQLHGTVPLSVGSQRGVL